jgi:hypothetical protein
MVAFFKKNNKWRPTLLEALVGIFLLSLSLMGRVHADGKIQGLCQTLRSAWLPLALFQTIHVLTSREYLLSSIIKIFKFCYSLTSLIRHSIIRQPRLYNNLDYTTTSIIRHIFVQPNFCSLKLPNTTMTLDIAILWDPHFVIL